IRLSAINVEGRLVKPLLFDDVVPPALDEPIPRTLPADVLAAIDALDAVDAAARAQHKPPAKWGAASRDTYDAASAGLAASGAAALAAATGNDRRVLAYELLRAAPSLAVASALLCPPGKDLAAAQKPADLDACDGAGVTPERAAYAWLEVGRTLGETN